MSDIIVCTEPHSTTPRDHYEVLLSDDTKLFEDQIPDEESSWIRIKKYLSNSNKKIQTINYRLGIYDNILPQNKPYYFYTKGMGFVVGGGIVNQCTKIGWSEDGVNFHIKEFSNEGTKNYVSEIKPHHKGVISNT